MLSVTFKNLLAHMRRLLSTFLAVLLGIAFLSGTLILGDTIKHAFSTLLATVNSGADAYVRVADTSQGGGEGGFGGRQRVPLDESVVATIRSVPGAAAAEGDVQSRRLSIVGKDGKVLGASSSARGTRVLGASWRDDAGLNPFRVDQGRAPSAADDVVIDRVTATKGGFHVGDPITVLIGEPLPFHISGIASFGGQDPPGGVSDVLFTLPTAQRLLGQPGKVTAIVVRADKGVSQAQLVDRIKPKMAAGVEVLTGDAIVKETQDTFQQRINGFTTFLSSFAFVAVVVGAFVIYNTFSIIIAQRSREMALLRAVGATRAQVLWSVLAESVVVGVVASAAGVVAGIGVGGALRSVFKSVGFPFPPGGLILRLATVVIGMVVGVAMTTLAAILPARRASRVAPIEALREAEVDTSNTSRKRMVAGIIVTAIGVVAIIDGIVGQHAQPIGLGALLVLVGTVLLGPIVAAPIAHLIGTPAARATGVTGELARDNAMRNPTRTAGTAAALLVGVAVVSFFSVIAASLQATTADQIDKTFVGDVAVSSPGFGGAGFSPKLAASIGQLRSVAAAAPVRFASVTMDGAGQDVFITDPQALATVVSVDLTAGSLRALGPRQLAVSDSKAKELHKGVGDTITIQYPGREPVPLTIAAVFKPSDLLDTAYVVPTAVDDAQSAHPLDVQILVKFRSGESFDTARADVAKVAAAYPNARVEDQHEIKQGYVDRINGFLALIFGMLALAIVIALMGISNTLQLSVFERTRELGLLRAVGATRQQLRAMVRWESLIIALFGTLGGLGLGVVFGWAIVHGLGRDQHILFRVPAVRAVVIVVVGGLAGVVAALRPARRAGRLNVIAAIASE